MAQFFVGVAGGGAGPRRRGAKLFTPDGLSYRRVSRDWPYAGGLTHTLAVPDSPCT